ncbi:pyrroline-5-carboxylate reductase [Sinimarinibacterium thermocellulolyticum]|uniref:Pyrroline-5-carboxylate reductase n=1 Tax=Sinimarinibacterium thermocellulolyticum TaxID=3170016 RepID=A0ABV2A5N3_9GAMM
MSSRIAFIGGGNMAASLIGGLLTAGHDAARIRVAEIGDERRAWLRQRFGVEVFADAAAAIDGAEALVLAVKPQQMREALAGLRPQAGTTVISIAAGLALASLRRWLGAHLHYVRSMPNTPALLGAGISGLYAPPTTPASARALAESILGAAGDYVWLDEESQMDAVTAVSGSGPAYYFALTEALREAGVALGLAPETAARLARQTFIGAARMAAGDDDVAELRARVTSKGGTTEAALQRFEAGGLSDLVKQAVAAAARRGAELGAMLDREA